MASGSTYRPDAPLTHPSADEHRRLIAQRANVGLPRDGSLPMNYPLPLVSYAVADLPTASLWPNSIAFCPDETGGATVVFSDGTDWRRVQDRAVAS